jgi:hypothetical protein
MEKLIKLMTLEALINKVGRMFHVEGLVRPARHKLYESKTGYEKSHPGREN